MRIVYIDIDSLRPDHLGCYGYHRQTSPNIDAVAARSTRFDNCYTSDAPCLPSRTALWSGRFGLQTGVVGHGGTAAQPFVEGASRDFRDTFAETSWMTALRKAGYTTASVSPFAERHGAWHWCAGFNEMYNTGKYGGEIADDITPIVLEWLRRNGNRDNWFLHVNYWDPHTPYRTPLDFGNPFADDPPPDWPTEEIRAQLWDGYGPHSTQEPWGWGSEEPEIPLPRMPRQIDSMEAVKRWFDGYDTGIRYVDGHIGRVLNALADLNVLDETIVVIGADHGENQGELNVWGDHMTGDHWTCRVPLLISYPGITDKPQIDTALHYHFDWAATLIDLVGGTVPENWNGTSFAPAFRERREQGRDSLVCSQAAWTCSRAVRFAQYMCLFVYHDGYKALDPVMLFDLENDPHEQVNLAGEHPELVNEAAKRLVEWHQQQAQTGYHAVDPMLTVLREGGPFHIRGMLPLYVERLRATGRAGDAGALLARHRGT
ncbi:sulfatase [Aggregatilinea lenta]|uniref:sulfatase n=1 Tax=Aggregatilinea lenta TaxID=913108 RepID=UPI000E5B61D8|nr:sulfatase [Aggregatilinea lenta]